MAKKSPAPKSPAPSAAQAPTPAPGFWRMVGEGLREEKDKGNLRFFPSLNPVAWFRGSVRQQREMMATQRTKEFLLEAKDNLKRASEMRVNPTRVDAFEDAVARQGLSEEFLQQKMQRHKWTHLGFYVLAGTLFVYAFWLLLNHGLFVSAPVFVVSLCAFVRGYLSGFRAWQIEHRNLIRLQDALRIPGTYLVL